MTSTAKPADSRVGPPPTRTDSADGSPAEARPFYPVQILRFVVGYGCYFGGNLAFLLCGLPLVILLAPFPRLQYRFVHWLVHAALTVLTRWYLPLLGVYRIVEISGLSNARAAAPVIYAANHRGRIDALMVLSLLERTGVVVKSKYARIGVLAALVRHFDFVSVDAHLISSVSAAMELSRGLLRQGKSLLVFPEGSRSASGRLQPFKSIAFRLAEETRRPVVPVIVHSTCPFMAKVPGSILPRERNRYRVRFLEPCIPAEGDTAETLGDRVYKRMAAELKQLDRGTAWEVRGREEP